MNNIDFSAMIADELKVKPAQVRAAIKLFGEGATVPFIARYRKELTEGLDDIQLRQLEQRLTYLSSLQERKQTILSSIELQQKLTNDLRMQIEGCQNKTELEDIYRPFKPIRNSKATKAKEAGLEPLALALLGDVSLTPQTLARAYINPDKGVDSIESALTGAQDILVERLAQDPGLVSLLRGRLWKQGEVQSVQVKKAVDEAEKFKDYYAYSEVISKIPSHRALALFRGEQAHILKLKLDLPDVEPATHPFLETIRRYFNLNIQGQPTEVFFSQVINQAWRIKLAKSLESDLFSQLRERAEQVAIEVFAQNLKDLLLAAPAGAKVTLALDPGYRSGVKLAVVDHTGKLLDTDTLYPHQPQNQWQVSKQKLATLIERFKVELVSVGNGTASRETEQLVLETLKDYKLTSTQKVVVSEAGASVYSASELAQKEFPDLDVTLRGGVSIARRLQDPLAELVKIDPKAIGVGQYQHDVNQVALAQALQTTVEDCVNSVGVDLNTASAALLSYVSGLSSRLAQSIVDWRDEHGAFSHRMQLKKVARLGPKAFEQCAGFLRIRDGSHPLDQSAVHPESYGVVEQMAKGLSVDLVKLLGEPSLVNKIQFSDYVTDTVGLPTLRDIASELEKPGRDPRPSFKTASFSDSITEVRDLVPGLVLEGVVTNVTHFGAFVDIGVHQDGLVHISHLTDKYISDPREVVKTGQIVDVTVLEVDVQRKRISLSMKPNAMAHSVPSANIADRKTQNKFRSQSGKVMAKEQTNKTSLGTLADKFSALKR